MIGSDLSNNLQPKNPTATILGLEVNTFPGAGNGYIIGPGFPGTKIVRVQLHSKCGPFNPVPFALAWRNPPIVSFATKVFAYVNGVNTDITTPQTHSLDSTGLPNPLLKVNLRILMEGMYNPVTNLLSRRYTVTLYLRNAASPYALRDTEKRKIDSVNHSALFTFSWIPSGQYYLVAKHHIVSRPGAKPVEK